MAGSQYHNAPDFDEVYVISDLHMGGKDPGFQIFDQGETLKLFLEYLISRDSGEKVALVLNGDVVDFLATEPCIHFDPFGAIGKLHEIATNDSFKMVWEALKAFVKTENRHLVFVLGNHDIELGLPWVREALVQLLAGEDVAARGRIQLCLDGTGFYCAVSRKTVLCLHGNEYDAFNITDYEALRRFGRDALRDHNEEEWTANAGAHIVIEVMNEIKKNHPFVDLLKPEGKAMFPVLCAMDKTAVAKLPKFIGAASNVVGDWIRRDLGLLEAGKEPGDSKQIKPLIDSEAELASLLRNAFVTKEVANQRVDALLDEIEDRLEQENPLDENVLYEETELLGAMSFLRNPEKELLRQALKFLNQKTPFDWTVEDSAYTKFCKWVGADIDVLITGHTHQEKALRRGNKLYFNCGTWARLIQLTPEVLDDEERFTKAYEALKSPTLSGLDSEKGLVLRWPTVVSVIRDNNHVAARLQHFNKENVALDLVDSKSAFQL